MNNVVEKMLLRFGVSGVTIVILWCLNMIDTCIKEKQMLLDGTFYLLNIPHKWVEGYVYHGSTKVYKSQCLKCGFVNWTSKGKTKIETFAPFSLYR